MSESKKEEINVGFSRLVYVGLILFIFVIAFLTFIMADPVGPDEFVSVSNSTKAATGSQVWNISGGYISTFNLTATVQNTRWKAFVGNMTGSFTLDDATGSTIFDWTLSTVTGRIYATRNSSTVNWTGVNCSSIYYMEQENTWLSHSNADDNITATFDQTDHDGFSVGAVSISANSCPTLSTYVSNQSQAQEADVFEEIVLRDNLNKTVYATILEEDETGYNGQEFDFQMLVPENGSAAWTSSTAYYIYVELG